jgi:hypothetical protein
MTDHTARPESWDHVARQAKDDYPYADCLMGLCARVERLERAQQQGNSSASLTSSAPEPADDQTLHTVALRMVDELDRFGVSTEFQDTIRKAIREPMQPAPSTPAGQGELVRSVAEAMGGEDGLCDWTPEARVAILAVADWLVRFEFIGAASALRREVGR